MGSIFELFIIGIALAFGMSIIYNHIIFYGFLAQPFPKVEFYGILAQPFSNLC
jgi:hypothetical protein